MIRIILQTISILISLLLYIGATNKEIVMIISKEDFYITYIVIVYLIFLANSLIFYTFYYSLMKLNTESIFFKSIMWTLLVITPFIIGLLYGTLFTQVN